MTAATEKTIITTTSVHSSPTRPDRRARPLPLLSALTLTLIAATALVLIDPSDMVAAVLFVRRSFTATPDWQTRVGYRTRRLGRFRIQMRRACLGGMTYAVVSVHSPKPEHRGAVLDSMQRYSRVARAQPGLDWTGVVDDWSGRLVGIALWDSEGAAAAASPALMAAVGDDPFAIWDERPIDGLRGTVR